jgi:NAD+ synthase (glutamine-hydrolysing)
MKVIPANPQENLKKVLSCIEKAKEDKAEIIVFPEMTLPSYLIGDIWERESFVNECMDCLDEVRKASDGIIVVIGSIDIDKTKKNEDGRVRKYNT